MFYITHFATTVLFGVYLLGHSLMESELMILWGNNNSLYAYSVKRERDSYKLSKIALSFSVILTIESETSKYF